MSMGAGPTDFRSWIPRVIRIPQVIVGAMAAGMLCFVAVAVFVRTSGALGEEVGATYPWLTVFAVGALVIVAAVRPVVANAVVTSGIRKIAAGRWPGKNAQEFQGPLAEFIKQAGDAGLLFLLLMTRMVASAALFEGAGFFLVIAYMLEGSWFTLAAAALAIACILAHWPNVQAVQRWITEKQRQVEQMRITRQH